MLLIRRYNINKIFIQAMDLVVFSCVCIPCIESLLAYLCLVHSALSSSYNDNNNTKIYFLWPAQWSRRHVQYNGRSTRCTGLRIVKLSISFIFSFKTWYFFVLKFINVYYSVHKIGKLAYLFPIEILLQLLKLCYPFLIIVLLISNSFFIFRSSEFNKIGLIT